MAEHGRESFEKLVLEAPDALDHKLSRLTRGVDFTRDTHAVTTAVDTMLKIVAKAPDGLRIDQLLMRMSRSFDFKVERLEKRLQFLRSEEQRKSSVRRPSRGAGQGPSQISAHRPNPSLDPNAAFAESADFDATSMGQAGPSPASNAPQRQFAIRPLMGIDRKLFEALIESPELAGMAVEAIDPDWLETATAKMLLSAYQDLDLAGHSLDVDSLLLLIENEQFKNQIVTLQERVRQHAGKFPETPEQRYAAIMTHYRQRAFAAEKSKQMEMLASASMDEDEEDAMLKALFDEERPRHGTKKR